MIHGLVRVSSKQLIAQGIGVSPHFADVEGRIGLFDFFGITWLF